MFFYTDLVVLRGGQEFSTLPEIVLIEKHGKWDPMPELTITHLFRQEFFYGKFLAAGSQK